jgi:hypothetical protein
MKSKTRRIKAGLINLHRNAKQRPVRIWDFIKQLGLGTPTRTKKADVGALLGILCMKFWYGGHVCIASLQNDLTTLNLTGCQHHLFYIKFHPVKQSK